MKFLKSLLAAIFILGSNGVNADIVAGGPGSPATFPSGITALTLTSPTLTAPTLTSPTITGGLTVDSIGATTLTAPVITGGLTVSGNVDISTGELILGEKGIQFQGETVSSELHHYSEGEFLGTGIPHVWFGGVLPTGVAESTFHWTKVGSLVQLWWTGIATNAGTGNTNMHIDLRNVTGLPVVDVQWLENRANYHGAGYISTAVLNAFPNLGNCFIFMIPGSVRDLYVTNTTSIDAKSWICVISYRSISNAVY